jgi:arylsulfatase A-like enzyme
VNADRSKFVVAAVVASGAAWFGASATPAVPAPADSPTSAVAAGVPARVLLVTWDTTRADHVGCYGGKARTPTFDALAASGVSYGAARAVAPITLTSHTSLLTGVLPCVHRVRDNELFTVTSDARLLSEAFKDAGFRTGAFVGAFVLDPRFGLNQGFDVYDAPDAATVGSDFDVVERSADAVADRALAFVDTLAATDRFFVWLHFYDPHHPHVAPSAPSLPAADAAAWKSLAPYDAEISFCDLQLKRVLDHLKERGLDQGLVTCVTADHGESFDEHHEPTHGILVHDATMRVPLVVSPAPTKETAGTRVSAPVSLVDVAATLLERAGVGRAALPDDHSPLLPSRDAEADGERAVWLESFTPYWSHRWSPLRAIVWKGAKYVEAPKPELYDLAADAAETKNLAAEKPELAAKMRQRLLALEKEQAPLPWSGRRKVDDDERARFAKLGYLSAPDDDGALDAAKLPDPKDRLGDLALKDQVREIVRAFSAVPSRDRARAAPRLDEARRLVAQLKQNNAADPFVDSLTASIELAAGDFSAAVGPLERDVAADPRSFVKHHNLGMTYANLDELELARREMEKAVSLAPSARPSIYWLLLFHRKRQHWAEAMWYADLLVHCPAKNEQERMDAVRFRMSMQQKLGGAGGHSRPPTPVTDHDLLPERWLAKDAKPAR